MPVSLLEILHAAHGAVNASDRAVCQRDAVAKIAIDRRKDDWKRLIPEIFCKEGNLLSWLAGCSDNIEPP